MMVKRSGKNKVSYIICHDHQRRTCLKVDEDKGVVKFIPLDINDGFQVQQTSTESFNQRYKGMPNYPIEQACKLYFGYCLAVGCGKEVLDYLSKIVSITKEECKMATSKRQSVEPSRERAVAKKKAAVKKKASTKKKAVVKKVATKKKDMVKKKATGSYTSAAQMFQALIMEGKLTDSKIFERVQAEFGLDDKKRGYVKWYRNNLKKKGENPPESKGE